MRSFFVFCIFAFVLANVHSETLRDIRGSLTRGEYADVAEQLLEYLEISPENTEFVEQIISSVRFQLEKQRVDMDRFIRQIETDPDDLEALQRAAVAMERSGRDFGLDLEINTEELLDISLASKEYFALDDIFERMQKALDAHQFVAAAGFIREALVVGRDRFIVVSGGEEQAEATAISDEILVIVDRFSALYSQQLVKAVRNTRSAINSEQASRIEQVASEINDVGREFVVLREDVDRVANRIRILQQNLEERITYPELLRRIVEANYYTHLSLANIIDDALKFEVNGVLEEYEIKFKQYLARTQVAMDSLLATPALSDSSLALVFAASIVRNATAIFEITDQLDISAIEEIAASNLQQATSLIDYYSYWTSATLLHQILLTTTSSLLVGGAEELKTAQLDQLLRDQSATYQQYLADWYVVEDEITALNRRIRSSVTSQTIDNATTTAERFVAAVDERTTQLYNNYFADITEQYYITVEKAEEAIEEARVLVYGEDITDPSALIDIELTNRDPQEAISTLDDAIPQIDLVSSALLDFEPLYRALQSIPTINLDSDFENLLVRVIDTSNALRSLHSDATENVAQAMQLRTNGENLRVQAQLALDRGDGREASRLWEQARANYLDSLALSADEQLQNKIEQYSVDIRNRILELEHIAVVREVRELLDRARRAIAIQDIDEAYSLVESAAELWAITNVDPNAEIVRQQEYIELVLTFEQIYNLTSTDPLYGVLSGYVSNAAKNIDRINQLISQEKLTEAELLLAETARTVQNVIDVQPFNTEARTLNLRLIALRDAEELRIILDELFESASRASSREPRQSLSDFYTIRALLPDYPGVEQQITELEVALGLRIVESNNANQQQADRLLAQAQELIETGDQNRLVAATNILQQALTLDPNNSAVQSALDQVRIDTGSNVQASISFDDERLLRRAETLFVQGNLAQTFAILENLWSAPPNRNYPPLIALRDQVISRLGI